MPRGRKPGSKNKIQKPDVLRAIVRLRLTESMRDDVMAVTKTTHESESEFIRGAITMRLANGRN